jgi:hypothetical protein
MKQVEIWSLVLTGIGFSFYFTVQYYPKYRGVGFNDQLTVPFLNVNVKGHAAGAAGGQKGAITA